MSRQPLELAPLRFGEAPLKVHVVPVPGKKDTRHWLRDYWPRYLLGFITLATLLFWAFFILPQDPLPTGPFSSGNLTGAAVGFTAPSYMFLADENAIDATVLNTSAGPFKGTVTLVFSQPVSLSIAPDPDGNTWFTVTDLPPGARFTRRIKFILHEAPPEGRLKFQLKAETPDGRTGATEWQTIELAPFSFLHRFLKYLAGANLFAVFIGLFWERFKPLLIND